MWISRSKKKRIITPTMPVYIDNSTRNLKKWRAEIFTKKVRKKLGRFATKEEAQAALDYATGKRQMNLFK